MKNNKKSAFTLVELAIVLIIIGLITGGVVGAQSLIKSSKRTKFITDVNNFRRAFYDFYNQYDATPGDFDEAGDYFDLSDYPSQHSSWPNGDGRTDKANAETIMTWVHLAKAEIMPQLPHEYDNVAWPNSRNGTLGVNIPKAPWDPCGYMISYDHNQGTTSYKNWFMVSSNFDSRTGAACVSSDDTKFIDRKIDDGNGITGKIMATHARTTTMFGDSGIAAYRCLNLSTGVYAATDEARTRGCVLLVDWNLF